MEIRKILIIDHHPIVRKGLAELIRGESDLEVAGESASAHSIQKLIEQNRPNLVIIDISLKDGCGIEFIKDMRNYYPEIGILVFSNNYEVIYADHVLRAGAVGYLIKEESVETILLAIRQVLLGEIYVSERIRLQLLKRLVSRPKKNHLSPMELLSAREMEVFQLIGEGLSTRKIAVELGLGIKTIETYRFHIKKKLGIQDNTQLIQQAVRWSSGLDRNL